jgi:signal transduction histidine kinase
MSETPAAGPRGVQPERATHAAEDAEALVRRMIMFMRSNQAIAAGVFVAGAVIGVFVVQTWLAVAFLGVIVTNMAAMEACIRWIDTANATRVALVATLANWALCVALAPMVSFALPVLLFPVLITLLAMAPLLDRRQIRWFIVGAAVVMTTTASLALAIEGPIDEQIPDNLGHVLVVVALAAFTVPTGFLAWDTHVRNAVAVERLDGINAELRASRRRLVDVADDERRQLERNLHDGAQQQLVGLAIRLRLLGVQHAAAATDVEGLLGDLQGAIEELRDLAHGLYPPLLEASGLPEALALAGRRSGLEVAVHAAEVRRYDPQVETATYFCALESLQNAAKYAGDGASVTITLTDDGEVLHLEVNDDGPGFVVESATGGRGLRNMTDRVAAVDGLLEVRSEPGRGTSVIATIPHGGAYTPIDGV